MIANIIDRSSADLAPPSSAIIYSPSSPEPSESDGAFNSWCDPKGRTSVLFYRRAGGYLVRFPAICDFRIREALSVVECTPFPGTRVQTCANLYENQIRPLIESAQGRLVIHAAAVNIGGEAALFVGPSGRGKSTLSTFLALNGHELIAEDGVILVENGEGLDALPGPKSVRLWNDSFHHLIHNRAGDPQILEKHIVVEPDNVAMSHRPVRVRRLFLLEDHSPTVNFTSVTPKDAFFRCHENLFILDDQNRKVAAAHLKALSKLIQQVETVAVHFPRDLDRLDEVAQKIVNACCV